jgi:hypothetical protein
MHITRILFVGSCVVGLAAACGGTSTGGSDTGDGGASSSSGGGSSSGGSGSGSSSGSTSGGGDATTFDTGFPGVTQSCASSNDCTGGEVCCTSFGMGTATIACAATCTGMFAFQLCASDTECPSGDQCVASRFGMGMVCQPARDAGAVRRRDGGRPMDDGGAPADTGAE